MKKQSIYLSFCILVVIIQPLTAQNLISPESWTIGTGSVGIFGANGPAEENIREWGEDPKGKPAIIWKAVPDATSGPDGGWNTTHFDIDHNKMYRFSVWVKKTNSNDGTTYLGCNASPDPILTLSGNSNSNPYFWHGDLLELNKWYLIVGYIHGSNDNSTTHYGGIYDGSTGEKVLSIKDFKFPATATSAIHRTFLYYDTNTSDRQFFYAPRMEMVTGDEPSIESLLEIDAKTFISNNPQTTTKLGINTTPTNEFELAVNGEVRAKEVKVETNWSDFVFEEDYKLLTLEEVEEFINKNGHLPDIPSSSEVEKDGIYVGQMDSKLQEKLAYEMGISQQAVSKIEQSESVEQDELERVAKVLGVNPQAIENFNEEAVINISPARSRIMLQ